MRQGARKRLKGGFTLIEIMVATVIMVIMVGLVIQITSEVLKVWNRSSGKLAANAEARIALDVITSDLENAVFRANGKQWFRVESASAVSGGAGLVGQTVGLKMFTTALDAPDEPGDLCGVAYKLAYSEAYTGAGFRTFILFRGLEGPGDTFNNLLGGSSGSTQNALDSGFWLDTSTVAPSNYLIGNVVDFKVFIYGVDGSGNEDVLNDLNDDRAIETNFIYGGTGGALVSPLYADIELTIVSDEGLAMLELPSLAGTGFSNPQDVVRVHGNVFTRRVYFRSRPL